MSEKVVTRFAPSPTGFLHIGGARTALFNWVFARSQGGEFLLRIEDTDQKRSTTDAIEAILKGMDWLGLQPDAAPLFQSKQQQRHIEVAELLIQSGHAYISHASEDEINSIREDAREAGVAPRYPGRDCQDKNQTRDGAVVRFKAPLSGETVIIDKVQGEVVVRNDQLDDLVLLRSDGSPTYMLAVVVDDYDMGVTHVIRGDDHLVNAARQMQIYQSLDWPIPQFAHIPLIHGADGAKLSKRHGALGAETYRSMGYLREAMVNYLIRLGWSHGDDEIMSVEQMVEWFNLEGINKAPARFDITKLDFINSHYIREADDDKLIDELKYLLDNHEQSLDIPFEANKIDFDKLKAALPFLRERAKTLIDLINSANYLFLSIPLQFDDKASKQLEAEGVDSILSGAYFALEASSQWDHLSIETALKDYATSQNLKFGKIAPPLRAILTGSMVSPGIYDVLYSLGKEESLKRIQAKISI